MSKRTWVVIVVIAVIVGGVYVWSSIAKAYKTQELVNALAGSNKDEAKAMDAMQQLRMRGPSVGPRLVTLLNGSDETAAFRAASLLGSIDYAGAGPELMNALNSKDPDTRACAALALGKLHVTAAVQPLNAMAGRKDEELYTRTQAIDALGLLAEKDAAVAKTMGDILAVHPEVPPVLPEGVKPPAPKPGAPPPPPDTTIKLRVVAARTLGMIGSPDGVEPLRAAADSDLEPSADVRVAAAYALGDLGHALGEDQTSVIVSALTKALADKNGDVRVAAAYAFGNIRIAKSDRDTVGDTLKKAVSDDHYWVRRAARWSLARMGLSVPVEDVVPVGS